MLAEAEGRILQERQNEDVYNRKMKAKFEEQRKATKEAIETFFSSLGSSLSAYVSDSKKVTTTIVGLTALAAGVYATREVRASGPLPRCVC